MSRNITEIEEKAFTIRIMYIPFEIQLLSSLRAFLSLTATSPTNKPIHQEGGWLRSPGEAKTGRDGEGSGVIYIIRKEKMGNKKEPLWEGLFF